MATAVDICNIGLQKIGDAPITTLAGTDDRSIRVNRIYEMCRDITLQEDKWHFAIVRKQLGLLSNTVYGMAYFPVADMFVAVGANGLIFTSIDNGVTWEKQTSGTGYDLHAICVATLGSTSTLVVVGKKGTILTSPDGITWTARTSGVYTNLYGVAGYTDHLVACGAVGVVLSSTNGTTWTSRTSGVTTILRGITVYSVTPLFVIVGNGGIILTSDGSMTTWTSRTSGVSTNLRSICSNSVRYLAVGDAGVIRSSTDGTTWSSITSGTTEDLYWIAYADSIYKACGENGVLLGSSNGSSWSAITNDATEILRALAYSTSDDSWIMAGEDAELHTSVDGSTWVEKAITPAYGYDYEFALPGDCLQIIGVANGDDETTHNTFDYKVEGTSLLTDEDDIYLRYLARITDTTYFPWWFVNLVADRIAIEAAEIQVKSPQMSQDLQFQYQKDLRLARQFNNADGYVENDTGLPLWVDEGR